MPYAASDAINITNATAAPIRDAVSTLFDTPRKGQIPKNELSTKLLISAAFKNINQYCSVTMF